MKTIKSKYLNKEFEFEPVEMQRDDGIITILSHATLEDIIHNQMSKAQKITYDLLPVHTSRNHCVYKCVIQDGSGRTIQSIGESVYDSLKSSIAKTIPAIMASIRAFDRAVIRYLDLDCAGKVYSDQEGVDVQENAAIPYQEAERGSEPAIEETVYEQQEKQEVSVTVEKGINLKQTVVNAFDAGSEIIIFDCETTGLKSHLDRIIEISACKYTLDKTKGLVAKDKLHFYIKPPDLLDPKITELTGITDEFLANKPDEDSVFADIYNFFGEVPELVSAYCSDFDVGFLNAMYKRQRKKFRPKVELDICAMARDIVSDVDNYKLETVAARYKLSDGVAFHSADEDVACESKLFIIFAKKYLDEAKAESKANSTAENDNAVGQVGPVAAITGQEKNAAASVVNKSAENKAAANVKDGNAKSRPKLVSISKYSPSNAVKRIYVNTELGTVFYDTLRKKWVTKDADMDKLDMTYVEQEAWKFAGAADNNEFEKFEGKWENPDTLAA